MDTKIGLEILPSRLQRSADLREIGVIAIRRLSNELDPKHLYVAEIAERLSPVHLVRF